MAAQAEGTGRAKGPGGPAKPKAPAAVKAPAKPKSPAEPKAPAAVKSPAKPKSPAEPKAPAAVKSAAKPKAPGQPEPDGPVPARLHGLPDPGDRRRRVHRQPERPGEDVGAPARYDGQQRCLLRAGRLRRPAHDPVDGLVDGPVAAEHDDELAARRRGQLASVAAVPGMFYV